MRLLALIESPDHVSYRYRLEAFAPMLAEPGLMLEAVPLERNTLRRVPQLINARRAPAVVLQRKLLPLWQLKLLARGSARLIYDVDDALFQRDSFHPKGSSSRRRQRRFRATVASAQLVIAGNGYLKQSAAVHGRSCQLAVIPTCVEPQRYGMACHHRTGDYIRLGWIGSGSTLRGLPMLRPHLSAVGQRLPEMEVRLICDRSVDLGPLRTVLRPWSIHGEAQELAQCDIGFSWLPDDAWSRGKCGLKILQYMAAGLPVVANPVGMNREMVVHGRTGFLASTPAEWAEAVSTLARNPSLRRDMGIAGRRVVEEQYNVASWGPTLALLLAEMLSGGRPVEWSAADWSASQPAVAARDRSLTRAA